MTSREGRKKTAIKNYEDINIEESPGEFETEASFIYDLTSNLFS